MLARILTKIEETITGIFFVVLIAGLVLVTMYAFRHSMSFHR
jgi:hypothetical protein